MMDEIFLKAQQAVLYPITPLYDLNQGKIAHNCHRAFSRIFRMYDKDNDDIPESVTSPPSADAFYSEYPSWSLSPSARNFLTATFHQFDRDNDGKLSMDDILAIFAIVPEPSLPPWHPFRTQEVFGGCFSFPRLSAQDVPPGSVSMSLSRTPSPPPPVAASFLGPLSASEITISSTDDLPSVDVSRAGSNSNSQSESDSVRGNHAASLTALNFNDWMGHWHMINAISPISTRAELYRLGHMEATPLTRRNEPVEDAGLIQYGTHKKTRVFFIDQQQ